LPGVLEGHRKIGEMSDRPHTQKGRQEWMY